MKRFTLATAAVAAIGTAIAIPVLADGNHGSGEGRYGDRHGAMGQISPGSMMGDDMGQMMRMIGTMQSGQSSLMRSGMMELGGSMMSGGDHLQAIFDTDNNGTVTPEELRTGLLEALKTYDADNNSTLSLDEFETMHTAHIREMTVDRFQAFDADGDGQVTAEEIVAPAERMQHMIEHQPARNEQRMPMMDGNGEDRGMMGNN